MAADSYVISCLLLCGASSRRAASAPAEPSRGRAHHSDASGGVWGVVS